MAITMTSEEIQEVVLKRVGMADLVPGAEHPVDFRMVRITYGVNGTVNQTLDLTTEEFLSILNGSLAVANSETASAGRNDFIASIIDKIKNPV